MRELTALQRLDQHRWRLVHDSHGAILAIPLRREHLQALRAAIDVTLAQPTAEPLDTLGGS
jgi:hypothetical protein